MAYFILLTWQAILIYWRIHYVVMVTGGNGGWQSCWRWGGGSLSFELYCCYRFPIQKKDGLLYWPTTSMKVYLNHTGHLPAVHFITNVMQCSDSSVCMPGCCYYYYARCLCFCAPTYIFCFFTFLSWKDCVWDGCSSWRKYSRSSYAVCWRM